MAQSWECTKPQDCSWNSSSRCFLSLGSRSVVAMPSNHGTPAKFRYFCTAADHSLGTCHYDKFHSLALPWLPSFQLQLSLLLCWLDGNLQQLGRYAFKFLCLFSNQSNTCKCANSCLLSGQADKDDHQCSNIDCVCVLKAERQQTDTWHDKRVCCIPLYLLTAVRQIVKSCKF